MADISEIKATASSWKTVDADTLGNMKDVVGLQNAMSGAELNDAKVGLANVQTAAGWANFGAGIGNFVKDGLVAWGQYALSSRMVGIQEEYKNIAKQAQKDDVALKGQMLEIQEKLSSKAMDLQYKTARIEANTKVQIAKIKKDENVAISEHKAINELFWGRNDRYLGSPLSAIC